MKINAGQAPSTLIPEYIGSAFDKVVTVADNIETVIEVADNIETVIEVVDNIDNINTVADNIADVVTVADNVDYVKDVAEGIKGITSISYIGDEPPTQPLNGVEWYCTTDGRSYIWYKDIDSGQWVESSPQSTADDPHLAGNIFTLWKRSAAEAGLNLVAGSFGEGGVLTSSTDVLWYKELDSIYSWSGAFPKVVPVGSTPATSEGVGSGAWVDMSDLTGMTVSMSYAQLRAYSGLQTTVNVFGISNAFDGAAGQFRVNASDTTSADNGGTIIVDALGRRWFRVFSGPVDVRWFGADNKQLKDSTDALQKAFNTGLDVNIPDGVYLISRTLTASTQGARITASPGAIIKKTKAVDAIVVTGSNWELIGVRVNCNGLGCSGIGVKGANNLVSNCEVYGSSGIADAHGIYLDGKSTTCIYNRIVNNWVHQVGGVGIASNTAPDNIKEGNVVFQTGLEGITNDLPSYRSVISGNYINAACQIGGVGGIGIDQGSNGVVTNNVVNSTGNTLPGIRFQNNVGNTNFVTVTGNTITNNVGGGIHLYNNVGSGFKAYNNVISANTFQNNSGFDIKIDAGCTGNSVSGNGLNAVIIDLNAGGVNPKSGIICSFRAYSNVLQSDITGDGTSYKVKLGGIDYNNGTPWNTSTNTFTAPVSGVYSFSAGCRIQGGGPSTFAQLQIVQSGSKSQTAQAELDMTTNITLSSGSVTGSGVYNMNVSDHFAMQAGDTIVMKIMAEGSTKTMDIPSSPVQTWLSGVLIG